MLDQKLWRLGTAKAIRLLQLLFLSIALWFIYWTHIYEVIYWNKTLLESFQSNFPNVFVYSILIIAVIFLEFQSKRRSRISMSSSSVKSLEILQKENEQSKYELMKSKKMPSNKIGIALLIIGALLLSASVITSSTILAFIGLGLTFWGALFLFARSTKFVTVPILDATALSTYATLDRIIDDLNYKGKAIYIPPYPKEAYLPEHLKGLKEMVVFISAKDTTNIPTIEEMAKKQFLVKNPKGICITPPGSGLVSLFENELKISFTQVDQESLYEVLQRVIVDNLELATNFEIESENKLIRAKITHSAYKDLYSKEQILKSVHTVGCPLTSAVACALAKTTGKPVTIFKSNVSPDLKTIEVWYQPVEG